MGAWYNVMLSFSFPLACVISVLWPLATAVLYVRLRRLRRSMHCHK